MNVTLWDAIDQVMPLAAADTRVDPARLTDPNIAYPDIAAEDAQTGGS